jgi:hypothetical protein
MSSGYSGATLNLGIYTITCTGNVSIASDEDLLNAGTSTLSMSGSSAQTLGNPTLSNAFNDVTINQNVNLDNDLYVSGGVLTINANYYINTHFVNGVGWNVHLRGSGNVLVLNGWFRSYNASGNTGIVFFEADTDSSILNVPSGTGYGVNNSYTAAAIRLTPVGNISSTYSLQGNINNIDNFGIHGLDGGTVTFNTNDYNIAVFSFMTFGTDSDGEADIVCNYGSSTLTAQQMVRFSAHGSSSPIHNLQSSTWSVGWWSPFPNRSITFDVGTSNVTVNSELGESWQEGYPNDCSFYNVTINPTATLHSYVPFKLQGRLTVNNGKSLVLHDNISGNGELYASAQTGNIDVRFQAGHNFQFNRMSLTGNDTYGVTLRSSSAGSTWSGIMTGYSEVYHVNVSDSEMVGSEIDALDSTNTDGGNNGPAWVFDDNVQGVAVS